MIKEWKMKRSKKKIKEGRWRKKEGKRKEGEKNLERKY